MTMSNEAEVADPLTLAIHELREEFLCWIDTELARLQQHVENPVRRDEGTFSRGTRFEELPGRAEAGVGSTSTRSGYARPPLPIRESFVDRDQAPKVAKPLTSSLEPAHQSVPQSTGSDPRQRLEALARLLDHRLRQVQTETETNRAED